MKFKIYFSPKGHDGPQDFIFISGETVEEIQREVKYELEYKRGLNPEDNLFCSERMEN